MTPAYSVIFFTSASGAGYGLLIQATLLALTGHIMPERWPGGVIFGLAFSLITLGLLSSTFHLGRPERAWRAFSQWHTSWLSREGVMAALTYVPAAVFAFGWVALETTASPWSFAGWLAILFALVTVWCTGMIYASLTTIRQWHHTLVTPVYVLLALATGSVTLTMVLRMFAQPAVIADQIAIAAISAGLVVKLLYWRSIDRAPMKFTAGQATGLAALGEVRALEPPHTQPNYVMREMGYEVGRKHAMRLRVLAILFAFVFPFVIILITLGETGSAAGLWALLAFAGMAFGILIERWLFFAEAQHVVTLYYGAQAV
jgi:DMSO reductase anchor subunit